MTEEYELPEYDLKINALEAGFLLGSIGTEGMKRMEEDMPSLFKKINTLLEIIYKV